MQPRSRITSRMLSALGLFGSLPARCCLFMASRLTFSSVVTILWDNEVELLLFQSAKPHRVPAHDLCDVVAADGLSLIFCVKSLNDSSVHSFGDVPRYGGLSLVEGGY